MALYDLLLKTLNQLMAAHVKLFVWYLTTPDDDGLSKIPPADLPEGSPRHEVVNKIVGVYGSEGLDVTIRILRKMNQNNLALILERNAAGGTN